MGERVASVIVRLPLYVYGDGRSTVEQLLDQSARLRKRHSHLLEHVPEVEEGELRRAGLTADSVLSRGEVCVLRDQANVRQGGLPVDVTDECAASLKEIAIDAMWSLPGLSVGAVDLLVPNPENAEGAVALEVNVAANLMPHHYPAYGKPRHVASAVAEQILLRSQV